MKKIRELRNTVVGLILGTIIFLSHGCVYVVVGTVGALGGYVVSPDTVEGVLSGKSSDEVWDAVLKVVANLGIINEQNESGGVLLATVSGAKVTITTMPLSKSAVKLSVKARKAFLPRIKVAQDVYIRVERSLYE